MDLRSVLDFGFRLYHDTQTQQAPTPSYASDPTGLYLLVGGAAALVLLFVYFHKQNQKEK